MRTREEIQRARAAVLRARDIVRQQISLGHTKANDAQVASLEMAGDVLAWAEGEPGASADSFSYLIDQVMGPVGFSGVPRT